LQTWNYWISIWDTASQWHAAASPAYERLLNFGARLTTTSFVLLECGNAAARQPFRRDVNELRKQLDAAQQLVYPSERDWEMAWFAFERGEAGDAGIVDHVSFVVMRRLGITDAFTNDRHFKAAGFNTLF
jgi:predicted nucleic acid-binding protein